MITYHPRDDIYNCIYRIITILHLVEDDEVEIDKLKIIDFHLLFPQLISEISFPQIAGSMALKNQAKKIKPGYERLPDKKRLFSELGDMQIQALNLLKAKAIIAIRDDKYVVKAEKYGSEKLQTLLVDNKYCRLDFFKATIDLLNAIELTGPNGLKRRSGLMEYRYDAV